MNRDELKQYLPHRDPMLLVDEVEVDAEGVCHGRYRVREDEFFCQGHFPENPIMPGVVQCEIMAQCCALLVKDELATHLPLYSGMNNVKFKNMVRPGDVCEITAKMVARRGPLVYCEASLSVGEKLCCRGELAFALMKK
jgi:3-hydroxyacyl-[acyl-carrier-protein] dehydratase